MKDPKQLFHSDNKNINLLQMKYLIAKEIFNDNNYYKNDDDFKNFFNKLERKEKQLGNFAHFYYFICQPYKNNEDIREELRLVAITSLIEGMMQEVKFKDFFTWFESTHKGVNKIEDYSKTREEYLNEFGATRRIKAYFEKYISEDDKEILLRCIGLFKNSEGFIKFNSIGEVAIFLYKMRCDFVHEARMRCLCPEGFSFAGIVVKQEAYKVKIKMRDFIKMFERSFIAFWQEQI